MTESDVMNCKELNLGDESYFLVIEALEFRETLLRAYADKQRQRGDNTMASAMLGQADLCKSIVDVLRETPWVNK